MLEEHVHGHYKVVEACGSAQRQAQDVCQGVLGTGILGALLDLWPHLELGGARCLLGPGHRASHDEPVTTDAVVPPWPDAGQLYVLEPCLLEPLEVLGLCWEQHPRVREEARGRPRGMHRPAKRPP